MATTYQQDRAFRDALVDTNLLQMAIDWIASNLDPDDVFEADTLESWAKDNGFIEANQE